MTTYSLLHMRTPAGSALRDDRGLIAPLRVFTGLTMSHPVNDVATCSFTLPLQYFQTAAIQKGTSDILVYRDETPLQRFRVTGVVKTGSGGATGTVQVSAQSYRAVVNRWMFHDSDTLDYTGTLEQTAVAWSVLNEGQGKSSGTIAMTRGLMPGAPVNRSDLVATDPTKTFFTPGAYRGHEIESKLANITGGFEWDIEPDPANPMTALCFNAWNLLGRGYHNGDNSPLVLHTGTMSKWQLSTVIDDYANVYRVTGGDGTTPVYVPTSGNPDSGVDQGRWETSNDQSSITNQDQLADFATRQASLASVYTEVWTAQLAPGKWTGPAQMWLGDNMRLVIEVPTYNDELQPTGETVVSEDTVVRVLEVDISYPSPGVEVVALKLNRLPGGYKPFISDVNLRLANLERRVSP